MRLPRLVLLPLCAGLTAGAYHLVLFTNQLNLYRGGTYRGSVAAQAVVVLAIFACIEVMRTERRVQLRALAGAFAAPLLAVTAWLLWQGVLRSIPM